MYMKSCRIEETAIQFHTSLIEKIIILRHDFMTKKELRYYNFVIYEGWTLTHECPRGYENIYRMRYGHVFDCDTIAA